MSSQRIILKRKSPRKQYWDYSSNATYFITINVHLGIKFFGEVISAKNGDGRSVVSDYSPLGERAVNSWEEIPDHYPNIELDEFVIMPNHVHGIILFRNPEHSGWAKNKYGPLPKTHLGNVIRSYKAAVKKWANENEIPFNWARRYYDELIKTDEDLERVRNYIKLNPTRYLEKRGK